MFWIKVPCSPCLLHKLYWISLARTRQLKAICWIHLSSCQRDSINCWWWTSGLWISWESESWSSHSSSHTPDKARFQIVCSAGMAASFTSHRGDGRMKPVKPLQVSSSHSCDHLHHHWSSMSRQSPGAFTFGKAPELFWCHRPSKCSRGHHHSDFPMRRNGECQETPAAPDNVHMVLPHQQPTYQWFAVLRGADEISTTENSAAVGSIAKEDTNLCLAQT